MAKFIGTPKEFNGFIGPRLCKQIQNWTRRHKKNTGCCEVCGAEGELHSAHRSERGRKDIITELLPSPAVMESKGVELGDFENRFKAAHEPFSKVMMALCSKCHMEYEGKNKNISAASKGGKSLADVLPIELSPEPSDEFKKQLLASKKATITVYYKNGKKEATVWDAKNFKQSSNVIGNLRSRPEFRPGEWQIRGIVWVRVSIP